MMNKNIDEKTSNDETLHLLPPDIVTNIHPKIVAVQIPVTVIKLEQKEIFGDQEELVYYHHIRPSPSPVPAYPLSICCSPKSLRFDLIDEPILAKVGIINCSSRPIYMQCCGLWGEKSRLGAGWRSYPRNRFWLAPGLRVNLFVQATPRPTTPVSSAMCALQIDASHLRDNVTGYFMVPIKANFLRYEPAFGE